MTAKELNGVKKSILNDKGYNLFAIIDLNKINNWSEVKGQSVWTSVAFKDHKEIVTYVFHSLQKHSMT